MHRWPRDPRSAVLTLAEEAMVVEFRCRTLLPLDDVLGCLRDAIPTLMRSSLHRELRLADGKLHMFLAIDRVSKFTYVEFHDRTKMLNGTAPLEHVIEAFPCAIHTILTDNGMAFADLPKNRNGVSPHMFDSLCLTNGIEHKLTKPYPLGRTVRLKG